MEIDVFRNAFLDGEKQGEEKGQLRLLQRQLEQRFGKLPKWALTQLAAADAGLLETWSLKLLEAKSLKEVLPRQTNGRSPKKR